MCRKGVEKNIVKHKKYPLYDEYHWNAHVGILICLRYIYFKSDNQNVLKYEKAIDLCNDHGRNF